MKIKKIKEMWNELSSALETNQTPASPGETKTPIPPEELLRFLELSLDARTDDYLRRLALFAMQASDITAISKQLDIQGKRLEQHDRALAAQSATLASTEKRLAAQIDRIERRDRLSRVLQPQDLHGQPAIVVAQLQREVAKALNLEVAFRHPLKDGGKGPEMLIIPPGGFLMGSPDDEHDRQHDEGPQHPVILARAFAIGSCAVTFADYDAFCVQTWRERPDDKGWGRGWQPAIHVSWDDALAYCVWLSQQSGHLYRLPSEAEWEYAARAGSATAFWWGDEIDTRLANYDGNSTYAGSPTGKNRERTLPVKQFQPNPFGLYQVHGNVIEWCQDRWHVHYHGAPADGTAWESRGSEERVARGGAWDAQAGYCRSASRVHGPHEMRCQDLGFRVCCDIANGLV